jgi:raffinose/stachyose/melibiose transport system substrate-binding protein
MSSTRGRSLKLAAALAIVAATALTAGVGVTHAKTQATVTLKLLAQSNGQGNPQINAIIANFEKAYPDIKVDATYLPLGTPYANALRTQLQSGNGPDVFYVSPGSGGLQSVMPLAKAGYVADLSARKWAKRIPVNAHDLYWTGKKLWAVPIDVVPIGVMYHTELLSQLGIKVPTTMGQLLAACRTLAGKGKSFLNVAGASTQNAGLLAAVVAGSYVLAKDPNWNAKRSSNRTTFAGTPEWRAALQRIVDMKNANCFPAGAQANDNIPATPGFVSGQVFSWVLPSSIIQLLKGFNPNTTYNFFPMPGETAANTRMYASPTDAFAMYSKTKQRDAALKFIDFWARDGQSRLYAKLSGAISLHQAATGEKITPELKGLVPLLKQKNRVFPIINLDWKNPEVLETLGKGVQGILTGQKTPTQILQEMDAAWSRGS